MSALYDRIGGSYRGTRREDPRIAALIIGALGDARSVVNVGAGPGAYEPTDREVLAIEPSETMIEQRPRGSAPVIQARAEALPLRDRSFDAALALNTVHHWTDLRAGLRELRRIARKRIVVLLRDARAGSPFWLTEDYLPRLDFSRWAAATVATINDELPSMRALPLPLPRDCVDGMFAAYWGRPESIWTATSVETSRTSRLRPTMTLPKVLLGCGPTSSRARGIANMGISGPCRS